MHQNSLQDTAIVITLSMWTCDVWEKINIRRRDELGRGGEVVNYWLSRRPLQRQSTIKTALKDRKSIKKQDTKIHQFPDTKGPLKNVKFNPWSAWFVITCIISNEEKRTGIESMTQSSSSSCLVLITLFSIPLSDFLPQSTLITVM